MNHRRGILKKIFLIFSIILITSVTINMSAPNFYNEVKAVAYRYGSRGTVVKQIQTKLKRWGYYNDGIDGIYGYQTYSAVKYFQRKNGLSVDGVAGKNTLNAMGISVSDTSAKAATTRSYSGNSQDVTLLARLINGEARGEPYEGQVAVGAVVLNRTRNPKFPSSVAGVIYQPGAFTAIVDGQIHAEIKESSVRAARDALSGWDPSGGAIYYYNPAKTTNKWIWSRPLIKIIGKHRFCR